MHGWRAMPYVAVRAGRGLGTGQSQESMYRCFFECPKCARDKAQAGTVGEAAGFSAS